MSLAWASITGWDLHSRATHEVRKAADFAICWFLFPLEQATVTSRPPHNHTAAPAADRQSLPWTVPLHEMHSWRFGKRRKRLQRDRGAVATRTGIKLIVMGFILLSNDGCLTMKPPECRQITAHVTTASFAGYYCVDPRLIGRTGGWKVETDGVPKYRSQATTEMAAMIIYWAAIPRGAGNCVVE